MSTVTISPNQANVVNVVESTSTVVSVSAIGPIGPQGLTGVSGSQGPQGIQGETGPSGSQGPQGEQGSQGEQGPQGVQGEAGVSGSIGPQGPQGIQGDTGASGSQGPQGIQGETGPSGSQGPQGETGPSGSQGPQGIQGEPGLVDTGSFATTGSNTFIGNQKIETPDPATNFIAIDFRNPGYGIYGKSNSIEARGNTLEFTATDYNINGDVLTHEVLTLRPEGRVGIGTNNPSSKLEIIGDQTITGSLKIEGAGGDEGGEIQLGLAKTNTTLTGSIVFDVYTDKLRLFEGGGNNRGVFLNVASQSNSVSSEIVTSTTVSKIETITSASYAALTPPVSGTLYIVID